MYLYMCSQRFARQREPRARTGKQNGLADSMVILTGESDRGVGLVVGVASKIGPAGMYVCTCSGLPIRWQQQNPTYVSFSS